MSKRLEIFNCPRFCNRFKSWRLFCPLFLLFFDTKHCNTLLFPITFRVNTFYVNAWTRDSIFTKVLWWWIRISVLFFLLLSFQSISFSLSFSSPVRSVSKKYECFFFEKHFHSEFLEILHPSSNGVAFSRHVTLPPEIAKLLPRDPKTNLPRLLSEEEWRALGVQQSPGWVHYAVHRPEPHVLLFRRKRTDQTIVQWK